VAYSKVIFQHVSKNWGKLRNTFPSGFPTNALSISHQHHACYMPLYLILVITLPNNIWRANSTNY